MGLAVCLLDCFACFCELIEAYQEKMYIGFIYVYIYINTHTHIYIYIYVSR